MNTIKIKDLLILSNPSKKHKNLQSGLKDMFSLLDEEVFLSFKKNGVKDITDMIMDSTLFYDNGEYYKELELTTYENMVNCQNYDIFYAYYNLQGEKYIAEKFKNEQEKLIKKEKIKEKFLGDIRTYEQLINFFTYKIYQHIDLLRESKNDKQHLEMTSKHIIQEWYTEENLNGLFVLLEIIDNENLFKKSIDILEYLRIDENKTVVVNAEELRDILYSFIKELEKSKSKIKGIEYKISKGEQLIYKINKKKTIAVDYQKGVFIIAVPSIEKMYSKNSQNLSLQLLQIFLHEYALYIFIYKHSDKSILDLPEWKKVCDMVMQDEELKSLLSYLDKDKGKMSGFIMDVEIYADLFTLYYYNLLKTKEDVFYKKNENKPFINDLMEYLTGKIV